MFYMLLQRIQIESQCFLDCTICLRLLFLVSIMLAWKSLSLMAS